MSDNLLAQKVLIYDPEKCSGCYYCMIVCSFHHFGDVDLEKAFIRVYPDEKSGIGFVNAHCTHCEYPLCEAACPTEPKAVVKDTENGLVTIDKLRCIGCKSCNFACPISIPVFNQVAGISEKCDFCEGEPLCARYCSTGALMVVTRGEAKKMMEDRSNE